MKAKNASLFLISLLMSLPSLADNKPTRGIGVYPGRPSESFEPVMVTDNSYRNVALHRAVYQSSSIDVNLTGQLLTDGILSSGEPTQLVVSTPDGPLPPRDKEKTLDESSWSSVYAKGEDTYLQFDWTNMSIPADQMKLSMAVAYREQAATQGYRIAILASDEGKKWVSLGEVSGQGLPGKATRQRVSSDPNKQETAEKLPLRMVDVDIPFNKKGDYKHLRIALQMKGCAYWRIYKTDMMRQSEVLNALPSSHFSSAWMSNGGDSEWVYVDLGAQADISQVILHWLHPAKKTSLLFSDDGIHWNGETALKRQKKGANTIKVSNRARYVKLLMTEPDASGHYALTEMQVMGRGGLVAKAQPRRPMTVNRYSLNGGEWLLRRDGDDQWITATVPGTVLTSYMNIGAVPNNIFANNMRLISESYFNSDFWYQTTFTVPQEMASKERLFLNFDGINWKAEIWLNDSKVGNINGAFIRGRFDITDKLKEGANKLVVKIIKNAHFGPVKIKNETSTDLNGGVLGADNPTFHASIGWDWITSTPGREAGIWNDVYLSCTGGMSVSDPVVTTQLNLPDTLATLTPTVKVRNEFSTPAHATLKGWIGDISFEQQVNLLGGEEREVSFSPEVFKQLQNQRMNLWWPVGYGSPYLYDAGFSIEKNGQLCDSIHFKAGIRQVTYSDLNTQAKIFVNGKRLIPLGGNWGFSETNLNYRAREYDIAVGYHKLMNMNMIRNWVGQTGDEEFYEACDRHGVMIWQDFWLANPADGPNPYDEEMFKANALDMIQKIRRHPSLGIYCGRNEGFPPATLDAAFRQYIEKEHPGMGYIGSSSDKGVSGHGPYRAIPVKDYFNKQTRKLHTERGMACVPSWQSVSRMLQSDKLWPQSIAWGQHDFTMQGAQGGAAYNKIIEKHFRKPANEREFSDWSQWLNYDGYRAMYESEQQYRQGLLVWMTHSCWPSMVWQTYDYYFEPTGAYFGARKACEPLHIYHNPVKGNAQVVDMSVNLDHKLKATAEVLNKMGKSLWKDSAEVQVNIDQTVDALPLQLPDEPVYYLRLRLYDGQKLLSENFYVEGREADNLQALNDMPQAAVAMTHEFHKDGTLTRGVVRLKNQSDVPALMIRLNLTGADGEQILPVEYSDNYFHLMPGETRFIQISYRNEDARGQQPAVECTFFNDGK